MKAYLLKNELLLWFLGNFLVISFLCYSLVISQYKKLDAVKTLYESKTDLLTTHTKLVSELDIYKAFNKKLQGDLQQHFLMKEDVVGFLNSISQIASKQNIELKRMDAMDQQDESEYGVKKIYIKLSLVGEYLSLIRLLDWFENYEKLIGAEKITIDSDENSPNIHLSMILTVYVIESKEALETALSLP